MPVYYPDILDERLVPRRFSYDEKDVALYALGVGMARDPLDERERAFVYEQGLKVMPTAVSVLASSRSLPLAVAPAAEQKPGHRVSSIHLPKVLHGEERIELHKPLAAKGAFTLHGRMVGAFDKGKDKGALIINEKVWLHDAGEKVVTITNLVMARADGGFGGPSSGAPAPHPTPARRPDVSVDIPTREDQALLYRLCDDFNPLHVDPEMARRAGFPRPILHGLCTFGISCRAVLSAVTGYQPDLIASHQARFSAPVFPGDTITVNLWKDGPVVSFEARVKARDVTVIRNGKAVLRS